MAEVLAVAEGGKDRQTSRLPFSEISVDDRFHSHNQRLACLVTELHVKLSNNIQAASIAWLCLC